MLALSCYCTVQDHISLKIDLPAADPDRIAAQIASTFDLDPNEMLRISAKAGIGIDSVLKAVVDQIPAPAFDVNAPLRALLFDSSYVDCAPPTRLLSIKTSFTFACRYDRYRGVVSLISLQGGTVRKGLETFTPLNIYEKYLSSADMIPLNRRPNRILPHSETLRNR